MAASVKWIKISTDVFDDEKIRILEAMPEGDSLIVCWIKLLCLAGKSNQAGKLMMGEKIRYDDNMLEVLLGKNHRITQLALKAFENFGMIERAEDDALQITNWDKHQSVDGLEKIREQNRLRKQKQREKEKLLAAADSEMSRDIHVKMSRKCSYSDSTNILNQEVDIKELVNSKTTNKNTNISNQIDSVFKVYEQNIGALTPIIGEKLKALAEEVGEPRVQEAIVEAATHNARSYSYIEAVARAKGNRPKKETAEQRHARIIAELHAEDKEKGK